jgi:putative transcriptional regulator
VVYLLDHDEGGSIGVVLNRPTETPVDDVVPRWGLVVASPAFVFGGGPVSVNGAICVARVADGSVFKPAGQSADPAQAEPKFQPVAGSLATVDLHHGPEDVPVQLIEARVFAGYAGWGAGQLEGEIESGAWFVFEGQDADVFDRQPDGMWPRVLKREGGWFAALAHHPLDPSVN